LPSVHLLVAFLEGISGEARRRERIVDLIQNAAANAAMRADKSQYEQFLSSIVRHRG
jgi:hypothetical protein